MQSEPGIMRKLQQLLKAAQIQLPLSQAEIIPLTEGGSDRLFYRIKNSDSSVVVMASRSPRFDIASYISVGTFLFSHGIGVPEIIACDADRRMVLLEDLGDESLYAILKKPLSGEEKTARYQKVLVSLAEMQMKTAGSLESCAYLKGRNFGYEALRWETDYFTECFLKRFCSMQIEAEKELEREFHLLGAALADEPKYFMHRDFQSQNIYFKNGRVRIIDFQTATRGLLQYDAVSLLKDAYYVLNEKDRNELLNFYIETLTTAWGVEADKEQFIQTFHLAGLQRNMQALGAFAYLTMDKGKTAFAAHMPNALLYLKEALQGVDRFPVLKEMVQQAEEIVKSK